MIDDDNTSIVDYVDFIRSLEQQIEQERSRRDELAAVDADRSEIEALQEQIDTDVSLRDMHKNKIEQETGKTWEELTEMY